MADFTDRTARLIGAAGVARLAGSTVAIFGLGGVGSCALEAVARAGVGTIIMIDDDTVDVTNINRQLLSLHSNIGKLKTETAAARVTDINPACTVYTHSTRITRESVSLLDGYTIDVAIDCIDSVEDKIALLSYLDARNIVTVSAMGAALKRDPAQIEVVLLEKTTVCPLARKIRRALKDVRSSGTIYAVSSREQPQSIPPGPLGTLSYMPALFGLRCAAAGIEHLLRDKDTSLY